MTEQITGVAMDAKELLYEEKDVDMPFEIPYGEGRAIKGRFKAEYVAIYGFGGPDGDIPDVCFACGGPYPDCTTSCKMISD